MKNALQRLPILPSLLLVVLAIPGWGQRESAFMEAFRGAMESGDMDTMVQIVKDDQPAAIAAVVETCELISEGSSDQLETEIDALSKAWRRAFDSRFATKQYEYFSFLSGEYKRQRAELAGRLAAKLADFEDASGARDKRRIPSLGLDFEGLSAAFEQVGDLYQASTCAYVFALCFDTDLMGSDADLRRACSGYGKASALREKLDLRDADYGVMKARFDTLEFDGYGDPDKGPEARARARAESDTSFAPHALEATFELVSDLEKVRRPIYHGDSIYQVWAALNLGKNDSTGRFPALERSPTVIRETAAKALVDTNGDGDGDVSVPVTGKVGAVQLDLDDDKKWGFLATIGQERDTYQGIQPFNLAPNDDQMVIYIAPAASIVGMVEETRLQIFDDNMDGVYGSAPKAWNLLGLRRGDSQPDLDSILVGEGKRALPWSEMVKIGENWYRLKNEEGAVIVQKDEIDTGTLKLDLKGLKADYMILRGKGNLENVFIDVAAEKKGVEAPIGSYELFVGQVSKGKRNQMMKALVLPARNTPSWRCTVGQTTDVELGSPFGFDFEFSQNDEAVRVEGESITVVGRGNETYQRLWNCVARPEVVQRKAGSKKGGKGEKMRPAESQEEMSPLGWASVWFPVSIDAPKKKKGESVEVQLVEKKNKLFGSITSDWKEG
jgi:hypothetical protein